jgi:hypothetical protein
VECLAGLGHRRAVGCRRHVAVLVASHHHARPGELAGTGAFLVLRSLLVHGGATCPKRGPRRLSAALPGWCAWPEACAEVWGRELPPSRAPHPPHLVPRPPRWSRSRVGPPRTGALMGAAAGTGSARR